MAIEIKNVCLTYMQDAQVANEALKNINLTIQEDEFVSIIGHTGSGKSTLISTMNGLLQPTSGKVFVDGIDMSDKKNRKTGRAKVGMVFQYPEYQLFEETVEKDIMFGPKNMGLSEEECHIRAKEAMTLVGLDYQFFAEKSPFELSGGEKRRAALAGIIAMRPKYLVLDEPMAGLDPRGRRLILDTVCELKKTLHCAVVMVSHSMDDVARISQRVIVVSEGEILYDDTPENVFSHSEELKSIGLGLPTAVVIANRMRENGIDVPPLCDIDKLAQYIEGRLNK